MNYGGVVMKQNKRILDTDLMVITKNALRQNNMVTLEDLAEMTRMELSRIPNLGKKSISHIEQVLFDHGYRLRCRNAAYNTKYRFDEDKLAVIIPRLHGQLKMMLNAQSAIKESMEDLEQAMRLARVNHD